MRVTDRRADANATVLELAATADELLLVLQTFANSHASRWKKPNRRWGAVAIPWSFRRRTKGPA